MSQVMKPLALSNGLFLITEFSATGGVKYARIGDEEITEQGDELTAKYSTRKDVDHVGLLKWSKQIINQAYGVMEKHASSTPIGYWIKKENAPALMAELVQVQEQAKNLNAHAQAAGSARRCRVDVWALEAGQEALESVAIRLSETVRERLERLRDDLKAGDLNAYATSWKIARNLPKLATGIQAESIVLALEAAKELRAELAEAIRNKTTPSLNLDAIDSAIWLFTDSVNGNLAEIHDPAVE